LLVPFSPKLIAAEKRDDSRCPSQQLSADPPIKARRKVFVACPEGFLAKHCPCTCRCCRTRLVGSSPSRFLATQKPLSSPLTRWSSHCSTRCSWWFGVPCADRCPLRPSTRTMPPLLLPWCATAPGWRSSWVCSG